MDNQDTRETPPTVSPPLKVTVPDTGGHISLSPPAGSPASSNQYSEDHISLSPSPARSSLSSLHNATPHSHVSSPENDKPQPSPATVNKDVFREPVDNRVVLEDSMAIVKVAEFEEPKAAPEKIDPGRVDGRAAAEGGGSGQQRVKHKPGLSRLRRGKRDKTLKRAALGFRAFGFLFCLISFSVMAADRNQGWAIDSFQRYVEFRYCMSVNVIGFVYSGAQAIDLWYNLTTGKYIVQLKLRHYFDFAFDQVIAYLLISASSSASIRIDDWQLNWGKDKFLDMATASISMSFLAFVAVAFSSLISGYALCTSKSL